MAVSAVAAAISAASYTAGALIAGTFALSGLVTAFAIGAGMSIITRALMPKPDLGQMMDGITATVREPAASRKIIYGKVRVGGNVVFITNSDLNKELYLVICFAAHEIESFESIWFNDEKVWENGSFLASWASYADFGIHEGDQTQSDEMLTTVSNDWTSTHVLNDIAYLRIRLTWDEDRVKFPNGVPNISAIIKGKKVYDPRKDSTSSVYDSSLGVSSHRVDTESTWEWSQNPALCMRDYLTNQKYGLGESNDNMDLESIASVADICDEQVSLDDGTTHDKYHCDGIVDTGNSIKSNIEALVSCMGGRIGYVNGKYFVQAAEYEVPTVTISEEHMVGPLSVQTKQSRRSIYNGVKGTFVSEEENYIVADYPSKTDSTYATEDGDPIYLDMPLPFVTNQVRAQRLAKIALQRSRQQVIATVPLNLAGLQFKAGDFIQINNSRMGWTNKPFEVLDYTLDINASGTITVNVQCIETDSSVYDWTAATDEETYNEATDPSTDDGTTVNAPTGLTLTETVDVSKDGAVSSSIQVSYTASTSAFVDFYQARAFPTADTDDKLFVRTEGTSLTFRGLKNTSAGVEYKVRVRAVNTSGVRSAWVDGFITLEGKTVVPVNPDDDDFEIQPGYQNLTATWTNPDIDDFLGMEVYRSNTSGGTFTQIATVGGNGGATASFVDTNLPDSTTRYYKLKTVDRSRNKSAFSAERSGTTSQAINEIDIVSSLPASGDFTGQVVFLTTDNKLYRWTGSAWTAAVPAVDVTGQLSDSQLAALSATKITGQLTDAQIAALATSKLTGTITATQITDGAISTPKLAAGSVTTAKLVANAVTANEIASNTITASEIAAGAVTTSELAANAVTANEIAANSVTASEIAANTITSNQIASNTITGNEIVANTITGGLLATASIITTSAQIDNGLITTAKIDDAAITTAKIGDAAVDTLQIAGNAVTIPEGADGAISVALTTTYAKCGEVTVDYGSVGKNPSAAIAIGSVQVAGDGSTGQGINVTLRRVYGTGTFTGVNQTVSIDQGDGGQVVVGGEWPIAQVSTYTSFKYEIWAKTSTGTRTANRFFIAVMSSKR
jgi:hypothetical protein